MLGQWAFFALKSQIPELTTAAIQIRFHIAAEALTAVALIVIR